MIDPNTAWELVRQNALKAGQVNLHWHSLVHQNEYTIRETFNNQIIIQRVSGGNDETLTSETVTNAIITFNQNNGQMLRGTLISPTVAEETALVLFHPRLTWNGDGSFIIEVN